MLGNNYIRIGGAYVPNPRNNQIDFSRVEHSYRNEAGDEFVISSFNDKARFKLTFNATSYLKNQLETYYHSGEAFTFQQGAKTWSNAYIESFSALLVEGSERTSNTDGLWEVSVGIRQL